MTSVSVTEFRSAFADFINKAAFGHERVAIERNGKPACAVVSVADLELLEALEDRFDLEGAREALAKNEFEDWDKVKAALGL
jgi:prevent-host-death family protein